MAKDEKDKDQAAEIRAHIAKAIAAGKEEGYVLEEVVSLFGVQRPQAKMYLDSVVPGRTPENPIVFPVDVTARRRASPHLERLPAVLHEDAALKAAGKEPRIRKGGLTRVDAEHVVFSKGKRQILKVKPLCPHNGKKWICITHGMIFSTEADLSAHLQDTDEHNTTTTEFDAPSLGEGHVHARWCEHTSRETVQNFMGQLESLWVQHGLEVPKE